MDGLWEPPSDPGYAVELWAMPATFDRTPNVVVILRDVSARKQITAKMMHATITRANWPTSGLSPVFATRS